MSGIVAAFAARMTSDVGRATARDAAGQAAALPTWLWLHFPIALMVFLHFAAAAMPALYHQVLIPEDGVIEWATPALLVLAMLIAGGALRQAPRRWMRIWLTLFVLGCFYFAGEEVSWGQRVFRWSTPDAWAAINKQEETNIHNVSAVFDSKPRLLFSLGVLVGAVIYPLSASARRALDRVAPRGVWPPIVCTPAAIAGLGAGLPERVARFVTEAPPALLVLPEPGEVKELYLAVVLAFYAASLRSRYRDVTPE